MLIDDIKADILAFTKARNTDATALLKIVLGECQSKNKYDNDFVIAYCRKLMQGNMETINAGGNEVKLTAENKLLEKYVPAYLDASGVLSQAQQVIDGIMAAPSEGQGIGVLTKYLKLNGLHASPETIKSTVVEIRKNASA
jgi:hypothetical protein